MKQPKNGTKPPMGNPAPNIISSSANNAARFVPKRAIALVLPALPFIFCRPRLKHTYEFPCRSSWAGRQPVQEQFHQRQRPHIVTDKIQATEGRCLKVQLEIPACDDDSVVASGVIAKPSHSEARTFLDYPSNGRTSQVPIDPPSRVCKPDLLS